LSTCHRLVAKNLFTGGDLAAQVPLHIDGASLINRLIIPAMAIVVIVSASAAEAKPKKTSLRASQAQVTCDQRGCSDNPGAPAGASRPQVRVQTPRESTRVRRNTARVVCNAQGCSDSVMGGTAQVADANGNTPVADANGNGTIVGSRPSGCPHQFCGCAASLYLFGEIRPDLNLAANWMRKFPHTEPASGMVAARNGHVMVLMSHASGDEWQVHDGNSGGGRTREHVRSIRGYTIVNPRATVTAER